MRYLYITPLPAGRDSISRGPWMTKLCRIMRNSSFYRKLPWHVMVAVVAAEGTIKMMKAPWYFVSFSSELVTFLWHLLALIIDRWFVLIGKYFVICVESELLSLVLSSEISYSNLNSELQTKKSPLGRNGVRNWKHFVCSHNCGLRSEMFNNNWNERTLNITEANHDLIKFVCFHA